MYKQNGSDAKYCRLFNTNIKTCSIVFTDLANRAPRSSLEVVIDFTELSMHINFYLSTNFTTKVVVL